MIKTNATEIVRRALPVPDRQPGELGQCLALALRRVEFLRRERQRVMEEFARDEAAAVADVNALVREQEGDPVKRHEDIECAVFYTESGERVLMGIHGAWAEKEVSRRPMTDEERKALKP